MFKILEVEDSNDLRFKCNIVYHEKRNNKQLWELQMRCKKPISVIEKLVEAVPDLSWILEYEPEKSGMLSTEYNSYIIEKIEDAGIIYLSVCEFD